MIVERTSHQETSWTPIGWANLQNSIATSMSIVQPSSVTPGSGGFHVSLLAPNTVMAEPTCSVDLPIIRCPKEMNMKISMSRYQNMDMCGYIFTIPYFQTNPYGCPNASKSRKKAMQPKIWAGHHRVVNRGSSQESQAASNYSHKPHKWGYLQMDGL